MLKTPIITKPEINIDIKFIPQYQVDFKSIYSKRKWERKTQRDFVRQVGAAIIWMAGLITCLVIKDSTNSSTYGALAFICAGLVLGSNCQADTNKLIYVGVEGAIESNYSV